MNCNRFHNAALPQTSAHTKIAKHTYKQKMPADARLITHHTMPFHSIRYAMVVNRRGMQHSTSIVGCQARPPIQRACHLTRLSAILPHPTRYSLPRNNTTTLTKTATETAVRSPLNIRQGGNHVWRSPCALFLLQPPRAPTRPTCR